MSSSDLLSLRVDQVGSLLRPAALKAAFAEHLEGRIPEDALRRAQDEAVRDVIAGQRSRALPVITDGEFRRFHFMESFGEVAGMEQWKSRVATTIRTLDDAEHAVPGQTRRGTDPTLHTRRAATERLRMLRNRPLEEFRFAQQATAPASVAPASPAWVMPASVKVTLIDVDRIAQGFDAQASRPVYNNKEEFLADVVAVEREIVRGLAEAGCRYVQIDGPSFTRYVDAASLEVMRSLGEDPAKSLAQAIAADNAVIDGHSGMTFGMHLCRGNRQSMWHREGAYDAIAEQLFTGLRHQRLLLEYDTARAGTFEPLRFVPKNKTVVLGLITTKVGRIETVDELKRRIDDAARFLPLEQLALSPQCGFSSDIRGNQITEDQQWRKLEVMMETARQVWS